MEQTEVDRRGKFVSPQRRRRAVVVLQGRYRASGRWVCRVVAQHRSTQRPNGNVVPIKATAYVATHSDERILPFTW